MPSKYRDREKQNFSADKAIKGGKGVREGEISEQPRRCFESLVTKVKFYKECRELGLTTVFGLREQEAKGISESGG